MDLITRAMVAGDAPDCAALLKGRLAYADDLIAALPRLWRDLLDAEALQAEVVAIKDRDGQRIVGFGCGVFVTDTWFAEIERAETPWVTARTLSADPSPILRPPDIGRENAHRGLNVLNLHYAEAPGLDADVTMAVRYKMMESFMATFACFRVKAIIQEFWDEIATEFIINGWGSVRSEYDDYYSRRGEATPTPGRRPYLVGLTRHEVLNNPGELAAALFIHTPPRMRFTNGEKALLRLALSGLTDIAIAQHLNVAVPTVKSRWRGIYQRVASVAPELAPDLVDAPGGAHRGQEKRRGMLDYLRRHREELRAGIDERRTPG